MLLLWVCQGHYGKCKYCLIVKSIFLVLYTIDSLVQVVAAGMNGGFAALLLVGIVKVIWFYIELYQIHIVYAFMIELEAGGPRVSNMVAGFGNSSGAQSCYVYTTNQTTDKNENDEPNPPPPSYSECFTPDQLNNLYGLYPAPTAPNVDEEKGIQHY